MMHLKIPALSEKTEGSTPKFLLVHVNHIIYVGASNMEFLRKLCSTTCVQKSPYQRD